MFCSNCGTKLPEQAGFCPNCGAKVAREAATVGAQQSGGIFPVSAGCTVFPRRSGGQRAPSSRSRVRSFCRAAGEMGPPWPG